jgi:hypothetical protein
MMYWEATAQEEARYGHTVGKCDFELEETAFP